MINSAVITADIVNSMRLGPGNRKRLMSAVTRVTRLYKLEFYRGDSFQVYMKDAGEALRLLLQLRSAAKSIDEGGMAMPVCDIRAAIGIGTVKTPVKDLRTATGAAFVLSGKSLDTLQKPGQRLTMVSGKLSPANTP